MDYASSYALITSTVTSLGVAFLAILSALVVVATGLLVVKFGMAKISNVDNMPGSAGYDSRRGSGASANNVARLESQGSTGKKINLLA